MGKKKYVKEAHHVWKIIRHEIEKSSEVSEMSKKDFLEFSYPTNVLSIGDLKKRCPLIGHNWILIGL